MADTTLDFKAQMAEARRTQILMGAAQIFSEKGFHQATIKEIAQAADVSEGTIYNYFDHKRELLMAMMAQFGPQSLKTVVEDDAPADLELFLVNLIQNLYQLLQNRGHFAAPILAETISDADLRQTLYHQFVEPITSYIETYLQAHTYPGELRRTDPIIFAHALLGAALMTLAIKATNLDPRYTKVSDERLVEQLVSSFVNGLRADNEIAWFLG